MRILVANRGEIAARVMRTAAEMGLPTVAVYAAADVDAPHVRLADRCFRIPSYLDGRAIVDVAVLADADAVHPGYGFLSENASFATAVIEAGLTWIGPSPDAIAAMGDKLAAKKLAERAGVPTLGSSTDGFPVLVKAAAGGGGKGMRIVRSAEELEPALAAARREAESAFGDPTVFVERFVERAHHVEVQVLGDTHGTIVHLGERECSIQRRHQKIVEESPSPLVTPALRGRLGDAALRLCRELGYVSAGTVEFLVSDDGTEFWFLEANTRLQVEHPVTEAITGIDLVREQIRIARGEPLDIAPTFSGHAVEVRLYAEDPAAGFLPSTGTLARWEPATDPSVRFDAGIAPGTVVGVDFDPMLAKVIAWAPTRSEAAAKLALALERTRIAGLTTNRDYLVGVLRSPEFLAGDTTTDFVNRVSVPAAVVGDRAQAAAAAALWRLARARSGVLGFLPAGWRNSVNPPQRVDFGCELWSDGTVRIDGHVAWLKDVGPDSVELEFDGELLAVNLTETASGLVVHLPTGDVALVDEPRFPLAGGDLAAGGLLAPMPGTVIAVEATPGASVVAGQVLVILEAMKMEHHVVAPHDGLLAEIHVDVGQQVDRGTVLLQLDGHNDGSSS